MAGVGPSEDTLQRVLALILGRVGLGPSLLGESGALLRRMFNTCKIWRREMQTCGFCNKTVQLCSTLAQDWDGNTAWDYSTPAQRSNVERLRQNALRRLDASTDDAERALCLDGGAFLEKMQGFKWELARCQLQLVNLQLHEWLQAASQEPDASVLSRGAASTAKSLGLRLVQWVGKPQERYPGLYTLAGHSDVVHAVALSLDGKRAVSGSDDKMPTPIGLQLGPQPQAYGLSRLRSLRMEPALSAGR